MGRAGAAFEHDYRLRNRSTNDLSIVNVINRKTCCGEVQLDKPFLRPGEETNLKVRLLVGDRFGPVDHETEILTEPRSPTELVLKTSARVHPPFRAESVGQSLTKVIQGASDPHHAEILMLATGTVEDPPVDLDRLALRSSSRVEWAGPKERNAGEEGIVVESRRVSMELPATGPPGEHTAEVVLVDGDQLVFRHSVAWSVDTAIHASPSMIVFKPGEGVAKILLRSNDQHAFRHDLDAIRAVGLRCRASSPGASVTHLLEFEIAERPETGRGNVTLKTDHPLQREVVIPFVVLE